MQIGIFSDMSFYSKINRMINYLLLSCILQKGKLSNFLSLFILLLYFSYFFCYYNETNCVYSGERWKTHTSGWQLWLCSWSSPCNSCHLDIFDLPLQTCLDETIILQTSFSFSFPVIILSGSVHRSCQLISCAFFICLAASFLVWACTFYILKINHNLILWKTVEIALGRNN